MDNTGGWGEGLINFQVHGKDGFWVQGDALLMVNLLGSTMSICCVEERRVALATATVRPFTDTFNPPL